MKELVKKISPILRGSRGESLIECIASILIFTILIACITTMILVSLRVTGNATRDADAAQADMNAILSGTAYSREENVELTVNGAAIDVPVLLYSAGSFTAFNPKETAYD